MDTHDTGRRQGTIQSQRQHGHTRHRSKARDNIEPDLRPVSCVSMLSLALYCPLPSICVVCVHVVSASILSLAFDLCRVCPCCLWLYIVPCLRPMSCVPMLSLALYCMDTHDTGRRQGTIQSQRQHGHTRHRAKARDNTEPETTWTHTTQVEGWSLTLHCRLPSTYVVCVHVVSGSILSLAFDLCRMCPCCLWLCIVPCLRPVSCVSNIEPETTWTHTT
jgi:hypothetical protein